jgi:hypothetical protein
VLWQVHTAARHVSYEQQLQNHLHTPGQYQYRQYCVCNVTFAKFLHVQ